MRRFLLAFLSLVAPAAAYAGNLAISADGKTLVLVYVNSLIVFDTSSGKISSNNLAKSLPESESPNEISISPSGKLLAVGTGVGVVLLDVQTGKVVRTLAEKNGSAITVAFSPDGKLVASGIDHSTSNSKGTPHVEVFDVATGASKWSAEAKFGPESIAWSPDGTKLAVDDLKSVRVFDVKGKELKKFAISQGFVAWSPDSTKLATDGGLTVALYDASSGEELAKKDYDTHDVPNHNGPMLIFSPDGGWIGAATKSGIDWYTVPSLTLKYTWQEPLGSTTELVYGANETVYALGDFGRVRALDGSSNKVKVLATLSATDKAQTEAEAQPEKIQEPVKTEPVKTEPVKTSKRTAPPKGSEKALKAVADAALQVLAAGRSSNYTELGQSCIQAVDAAFAKKIPGTTEVKLTTGAEVAGSEHSSEDGFTVRLTTLDDIKVVVCQPAIGKGASNDVGTAASNATAWLGKFKNPKDWKKELGQPDLMKMALDFGNECHAAVEAARKAGAPDSTEIEFHAYDSGAESPASLAEVDSQVCQPTIKYASDAVNAQGSAKEALYGPYLKVLSGDKAKLFSSQNMADGVECTGRCSGMYGHKMKRLKTPEDFKSSDVWYYYVIHRDGPQPTWEVEGWVFDGMSQKSVYNKQGNGDTPPASAFK